MKHPYIVGGIVLALIVGGIVVYAIASAPRAPGGSGSLLGGGSSTSGAVSAIGNDATSIASVIAGLASGS